ncbi:hypothetical protein CIPAW_05G002900 [Carya illinoinensis]|uniref:Uncharacterized protein n=1 Tax=Carya illinoinensis TaxID=32201 RepID=A0A8T1QDQ3_CARIL|nr:hypothetical protein CIPAW_05G002900 [Carya illinoinensis]
MPLLATHHDWWSVELCVWPAWQRCLVEKQEYEIKRQRSHVNNAGDHPCMPTR